MQCDLNVLQRVLMRVTLRLESRILLLDVRLQVRWQCGNDQFLRKRLLPIHENVRVLRARTTELLLQSIHTNRTHARIIEIIPAFPQIAIRELPRERLIVKLEIVLPFAPFVFLLLRRPIVRLLLL